MITALLFIDCDPDKTEEVAEVADHVAGVSETYVTAEAGQQVIAVLRVPDSTMYPAIQDALRLPGVRNFRLTPVLSARATDDLSRIRNDYE